MGWRKPPKGFKKKELGFSPGFHQPLNMPPLTLVREIALVQGSTACLSPLSDEHREGRVASVLAAREGQAKHI